MNNLTVERLRELLHYDPLTGIFTWRVKRGHMRAGTAAGCKAGNGYIVISVDDKRYYAHRLACLYVNGEWPTDKTDHRDTDRSNNRFANLRPADTQLNQENQRCAQKNNRSGFLGVRLSHRPLSRPYFAAIKVAGVSKHLGAFGTPEEAHAAYVTAKRTLHPGCTL